MRRVTPESLPRGMAFYPPGHSSFSTSVASMTFVLLFGLVPTPSLRVHAQAWLSGEGRRGDSAASAPLASRVTAPVGV